MTKNGFIEVDDDHKMILEACHGKVLFTISPDGKSVIKFNHFVI